MRVQREGVHVFRLLELAKQVLPVGTGLSITGGFNFQVAICVLFPDMSVAKHRSGQIL